MNSGEEANPIKSHTKKTDSGLGDQGPTIFFFKKLNSAACTLPVLQTVYKCYPLNTVSDSVAHCAPVRSEPEGNGA